MTADAREREAREAVYHAVLSLVWPCDMSVSDKGAEVAFASATTEANRIVDAYREAIRAARDAEVHDDKCRVSQAVCNCRDVRHQARDVRIDDAVLGDMVACGKCQSEAAGPLWVKWSYRRCADCYDKVLSALAHDAPGRTTG